MDNIDYSIQCEELEKYIKDQTFDYEKVLAEEWEKCPSRLDKYDIVFGMIFGLIGVGIDTNQKLHEFLDEIHKASNSDNPSSENKIIDFFAKLLKHKGDWIDKVPVIQEDGSVVNKFVNRSTEYLGNGIFKSEATNTPHRIFWGHDIFSIDIDNPFFLSIKQYGFLKGILQAIRHLLADTCSHQGIPIPFSSWFDKKIENGKRSNSLLDFCQDYSKEVFGEKQRGANNEVFNNLFTIDMQAALDSGFLKAAIKGYCVARSIENKQRICQIKIMSYTFNFLGSAICGYVKDGIPKINWLCLKQMVTNVFKLIKESNKETKALCKKSELIFLETRNAEEAENEQKLLILEETVTIIDDKIKNEKQNKLINFLGSN